MFWTKKSRPPLSTSQRLDIELLLRRTVEIVGRAHVRDSEILLSIDRLELDESSPERLMQSALEVARHRLPQANDEVVVSTRLEKELGYPSVYKPASESDPARIVIATETLSDSLRTLMETAYQYSRHYWESVAGRRPLDTDPRTTNLLPICSGLGFLASTACLYDNQWSQAGYTGWSISRSGYYNAAEIGYALALIGRLRGENSPEWESKLRPDSREIFRQARTYFQAHEESGKRLLFDADVIPATACDRSRLATWLSGDDPAFALAAGLALEQIGDATPGVIDAAMVATTTRDGDLVPVAARVMGLGRPEPVVEKRLRKLVRSRHHPSMLAALQSLDRLGFSITEYLNVFKQLLRGCEVDLIPILELAEKQGPAFSSLESPLCEDLEDAIRVKDDQRIEALLQCLRRVSPDPESSIERGIHSRELRDVALGRLARLNASE